MDMGSKFLLFLTVAFSASHASACDDWQEKWRTCVEDSDCVIVSNPCAKDSEKTVNKKFMAEAGHYLSCVNATKNCIEPCLVGKDGKCKQPSVRCEKVKCTLS